MLDKVLEEIFPFLDELIEKLEPHLQDYLLKNLDKFSGLLFDYIQQKILNKSQSCQPTMIENNNEVNQ